MSLLISVDFYAVISSSSSPKWDISLTDRGGDVFFFKRFSLTGQ